MAGESVIAALRVIIGADSAAFEKALTDAGRHLDNFSTNLNKTVAVMQAAWAGFNAVFGGQIKTTIDQISALGRLSEKIGISVEELSRLKFAAHLSGVELEILSRSIGLLSRTMSGLVKTTESDLARAFNILGINVRNADGTLRPTLDTLLDLADRFQKMEDGAGKTALAMAIFGRAGKEMIPLLDKGGESIRKLMNEAEEFGLVIDQKTAAAARAFNADLKRIFAITEGMITQLTSKLLPLLQRLAANYLEISKNSTIMSTAGEVLLRSITFLYDNVQLLINALGILIGLKIVSVVSSFAMAILGMARAVIAAGIATTLLNAAKTISIGKIAAFGTIVIWATGNLPAFTEAVKKVGESIAEMLPADTGAQILKNLQALGIDVKALTGDLSSLGTGLDQTKPKIDTLKPPIIAAKTALDGFFASTQKATAATLAEAQTVGLMAGEFERLKITLQAEALAKEHNVALTESLRAKIAALAEAAANAKLTLEGARLTEDMLLPWEQYAKKIERINELLAAGKISLETYQRAMQKTAEEANVSFIQVGRTIAESFATIADSFGKENKKMATIAKAFAIIAAIISAYEGAAKALTLPFPANLAAAATVLAKGFAFVAAIKSQNIPKFAQGGILTVGGAGAIDSQLVQFRATPGERVTVEPPEEGGMRRAVNATITVVGEVFNRDQVRKLIEHINAAVGDGARLRLAPV